MAEGHVNRTVLSSYYQNPGDVYDDAKTEGAYEVLAQQIDDNYDAYVAHKTAAVLAHPDGSVTTAKIKDGAVTAAKLDPSIVVGTTAGLVQANLDAHKAERATDDVHGLLSGGKIIEESGENENGRYVRFSDGTQVCWHYRVRHYSWSAGEWITNEVWVFPASFIQPMYAECKVLPMSSNRAEGIIWVEIQVAPNGGAFDGGRGFAQNGMFRAGAVRGRTENSAGATDIVGEQFIVWGRWK